MLELDGSQTIVRRTRHLGAPRGVSGRHYESPRDWEGGPVPTGGSRPAALVYPRREPPGLQNQIKTTQSRALGERKSHCPAGCGTVCWDALGEGGGAGKGGRAGASPPRQSGCCGRACQRPPFTGTARWTCHPVWSEQGGAHRPGSQAPTWQQWVEGRLAPCWEPVLPRGDWGPQRVPRREGAASSGGRHQVNTSRLPSPVQAARPRRHYSHRGRDSCAALSQPGWKVQTTVLPVASIPWPRPCWSLELVHVGVCDLRPTSATDWGL